MQNVDSPRGKEVRLRPRRAANVSMLEIQNELAIERGRQGNFVRLLWVSRGSAGGRHSAGEGHRRASNGPQNARGADLLETLFEDLRTVIHDRLKGPSAPEQKPAAVAGADRVVARSISSMIRATPRSFRTMLTPCSIKDSKSFIRRLKEMKPTHGNVTKRNLRVCDGVLIFFGFTNEGWVRRKLREVQKSVGYGRTGPLPAVTICSVGAQTSEKERFRTHDAPVIQQTGDFSPAILQPFIAGMHA